MIVKENINKIYQSLSNFEYTIRSLKTVLVILHEQLRVRNSIHFCLAEYKDLEAWLLKLLLFPNCFLCFFLASMVNSNNS